MKRLTIYFFILQGLLSAGWWALLFLSPATRKLFLPASFPDSALLSLSLPDLLLFTGGSLLTAYALWSHKAWVYRALYIHCGAVVYVALYCLMIPCLNHGHGWLAGLSMVPSLIGTTAVTWWYSPPTSDNRGNCMLRTSVQVAVFWTLFLLLIPVSLWGAEDSLGLSHWRFQGMRGLGSLMFFMGGALGLSAATCIAKIGRGTPFPLDPTCKLVTTGPYAVVRNPMGVGGIAQIIAVGMYVGSPVIVYYGVFGALLWHALVRPWEEKELLEKFGDSYAEYRRRVWCWLPRI